MFLLAFEALLFTTMFCCGQNSSAWRDSNPLTLLTGRDALRYHYNKTKHCCHSLQPTTLHLRLKENHTKHLYFFCSENALQAQIEHFLVCGRPA